MSLSRCIKCNYPLTPAIARVVYNARFCRLLLLHLSTTKSHNALSHRQTRFNCCYSSVNHSLYARAGGFFFSVGRIARYSSHLYDPRSRKTIQKLYPVMRLLINFVLCNSECLGFVLNMYFRVIRSRHICYLLLSVNKRLYWARILHHMVLLNKKFLGM